MITQNRLKEVLDYDPGTGNFYWKNTLGSRAIKGEIAGHFHKKLGIHTRIDQKSYPNHHLAWLHVYGYKPKKILHIDGNLYNNSINNLKEIKPKKYPALSQDSLKELLHYNPNTGVFTWKVDHHSAAHVGEVAGRVEDKGYVITKVHGKIFFNHRLAWLYTYGYFPEYDIDHINKIKTDNRIENLREVSRICNMRNTGNKKNNTSGVKGVCWDATNKRWFSQITVNRKNNYLGIYNDFDDAVCARLAAEQCLEWDGCDSNSPAFQYVKNNIQKRYNNEIFI